MTVSTPQLDALVAALATEGGSAQAQGEHTARVTGLSAARIGELAHRHGIVLHELASHTSSLESAFMALTADSVEYQAEGVSG